MQFNSVQVNSAQNSSFHHDSGCGRDAANEQVRVVGAADVLQGHGRVVPQQQHDAVACARMGQTAGHVAERVQAQPCLAVGVGTAVDKDDVGQAQGLGHEARCAGARHHARGGPLASVLRVGPAQQPPGVGVFHALRRPRAGTTAAGQGSRGLLPEL